VRISLAAADLTCQQSSTIASVILRPVPVHPSTIRTSARRRMGSIGTQPCEAMSHWRAGVGETAACDDMLGIRNERHTIGRMTFTDGMRRSAIICTLLLSAAPGFVRLAAQDLVPQAEPSANSRPTVRDILVISDSQSLNLEISTDAPIVPENQRLEHPDRLVFDFPGLALQGSTQHILVNKGPIIAVRTSLFRASPPIARIVVDLKQPLEAEIRSVGNRVSIRIPFAATGAGPIRQSQDTDQPPAKAESIPPHPIQPTHVEPSIVEAPIHGRPGAYDLLAKARSIGLNDLPELEKKADGGDAEAETLLALAYHSGGLLKNDETEALRLLHKAADGGFVAAQESLGIFYATGVGMEQPNPSEAISWYIRAARQGSIDAATNLGTMYAAGNGIPKDMGTAIRWFRQAADAGGGVAQYNLALIYGRGDGVERNDRESTYWLTKAADHDVIPALMDLARRSALPRDGSPPNVDAAIARYKKAAELGNALAQAILGDLYSNGELVKADYEQAVKWYRMAADQGQRDGQFGLAARYILGQGVPADQNEAFRWFQAAADQGHADAQYDLATMYETGQGTSPDLPQAVHYYQLAAEQGVVKSQYRLGILLAKSESIETDRVAAFKWLMLAQDSVSAARSALNNLQHSMSATEITEAEHQVDAWRVARKPSRP
jgi:TPR repeat protein